MASVGASIGFPQVQKILHAAYHRSLLYYFGLPLVATGVWDLQKINQVELKMRRMILGLPNCVSNQSIKGKTAHWFSRPLANAIVDSMEKQKLLSQADIDILK